MLSIKTRLTIFYALGSFLLLSLIGCFLYFESMNVLYKADYRFLADEVERLQYIIRGKELDRLTLKKEIIDQPRATDSMYQYYIRLIDWHQRAIAETPGMAQVLPPPPHDAIHPQTIRNYFWYQQGESNYLVIQAPIKFSSNRHGVIQIALDVTYQHSMVHDQKNFLIALLIGMFAALLIGRIIANRGMRSLYLLTEHVEQLTSSSLNERVNPKSWPIELASLGNAFNRMLDRFEDSFNRLKQFAADLAHELRTPINNLIGETEIALRYVDSKEAYQDVLESNLEELHRLNQLIENILYLAKTNHPQTIVDKHPLNVMDEIKVIVDYYQALADDKNIHVQCRGDSTLTLFANPIMFRRMISNLLSNALKYTPKNGRIVFAVTQHEDRCQIRITDSGIGIPKEHHDKIFDRFYRVDASRGQEQKGVGLGLAIVKSIIDLHQGIIDLQSKPGQGTTILIHM